MDQIPVLEKKIIYFVHPIQPNVMENYDKIMVLSKWLKGRHPDKMFYIPQLTDRKEELDMLRNCSELWIFGLTEKKNKKCLNDILNGMKLGKRTVFYCNVPTWLEKEIKELLDRIKPCKRTEL